MGAGDVLPAALFMDTFSTRARRPPEVQTRSRMFVKTYIRWPAEVV